jgi:anaerobic magnesium-protoporphyrin IX monomethyl ester cyclase
MRVKLVSLEDGTTASGFRKFAAYAERINAETTTHYVSTARWATIRAAIAGTMGDQADMSDEHVDEIAHGLTGADVVGFSSMTGYAQLTHRVIRRVRELAPDTYLVWGGIHPIIHPQDAITADVDAICTGEGEFAYEELLGHLQAGTDPSATKNFWFKRGDDEPERNAFLPLMSSEEMETLPFPSYGAPAETIYRPERGFVPMGLDDYLHNDGLSYTALWSIGCPFHCTYCGNTAFIANDRMYKKIRHPSARYIVDEIKSVRSSFPHLSEVRFLDDSFMAIPYKEIAAFAELWHDELDMPFSVYGVIPNYVKRDKFEILTWAGMNRIRMGIQSGSQRILDFYQRPSPPAKIRAAAEICASFSPRYHIPPVYDIIVDNPIETRQDVIDTLELLYGLPRPYSLLIYSLKIIPNTELARLMEEQGLDVEAISASYTWIPPRAANLLLYVLTVWRPPRWLWERLLRRVEASTTPQKEYPRLALVLRTIFLARRALGHLRRMDFSLIPGRTGYFAWKLGLVRLWNRWFNRRLPRPAPPPPRRVVAPLAEAEGLTVVPASADSA